MTAIGVDDIGERLCAANSAGDLAACRSIRSSTFSRPAAYQKGRRIH
jgi:hypothetical protein